MPNNNPSIIHPRARHLLKTRYKHLVKHGYMAGEKRHPFYNLWRDMLRRCSSPKCKIYKHYGGRGISVCGRWKTFTNFLKDMGEKPAGLSLERIDNDGDYEPGNVRWATQREQTLNKTNSRFLTFNGITLNFSVWADKVGISRPALHHRLSSGWTIDEALTIPVRKST